MRYLLHSLFAAALIAAPIASKAAPRSIDDCEKIQAADAYNQCLAIFGPVARGHHGITQDVADVSSQDDGAPAANSVTKPAAEPEETGRHGHGRHHAGRRHWARHHEARHHWARHGHSHHSTAAAHRHGKRTRVAFSTVSGRASLR